MLKAKICIWTKIRWKVAGYWRKCQIGSHHLLLVTPKHFYIDLANTQAIMACSLQLFLKIHLNLLELPISFGKWSDTGSISLIKIVFFGLFRRFISLTFFLQLQHCHVVAYSTALLFWVSLETRLALVQNEAGWVLAKMSENGHCVAVRSLRRAFYSFPVFFLL